MIPDSPLFSPRPRSRREFFTSGASGLGTLALASLLRDDGLLAAESQTGFKAPHFAPKAKNCIYFFMEGGPSQMDLFDPKPKLQELDGQPLPPSVLEKAQFAFIQKDEARLMGSPRTFRKYGQCGMDLSDLLPHLSTCVDDIAFVRSMYCDQFNHLPGQLLMLTGSPLRGWPTLGSWLNYGLGSDSRDLPGYVVLTTLGRGLPGGAASWSSGFLPSNYGGSLFRSQGSPVLNLDTPGSIPPDMQLRSIEAINDLNRIRQQRSGHEEITARIRNYELAFRMQSAAPELIDLSQESKETLEAYGLNRSERDYSDKNGFQSSFARNCLLARRLVERGTRFVTLFLSTWDQHSNLDKELATNTLISDQPVAALLKDLKERGLLDETLVVWGGEFGRTPLGENRPGFKTVTGRDHHPHSFSLWMAGGGIKGGQVIGKTDEVGWGVAEDPIHVHDLHATILHLFGFNHEHLTYRFQGRDFRITDVHGTVVKKLFS
ncbi:MAG: DUF1501 domain-containing protein [Verrucomicrobiae bacterium]|nr:DUF1501 domain-containing protein [Verrucomicrobiae bacterium]